MTATPASARLYLCTDGRGGGRALGAFLNDVLSNGVDIVQLRDKHLEARAQIEVAKWFRDACNRHGAIFIMNDRVDLALAAGADGVHLGQDDVAPHIARRIAGDEFIIGRSTHSAEDIARAASEGVDYIAVGPVYETPTKPGRTAVGLELVEHAAQAATVPFFAIGGVNVATISSILTAGAARVVVVRALTEVSDPGSAASALRAALDRIHV
jgi:thiamine-phosphate pyrophosphorylase